MERPQLSDRSLRAARLLAAVALPLLLLGTVGWFWFASLVPSTYSVMDMGTADYGGGRVVAHGDGRAPSPGARGVSVADLTGAATGDPDVSVQLTARQQEFALASGERVSGFTLNGTSPGPTLRGQVGDLVEVRLVNADVADGVTLHWHGIDVPNAEDGVAGVTQDAVPAGGDHVYRFVLPDPGTYWYHSHQVSHSQVRKGLFGAFVVRPDEAAASGEPQPVEDLLAMAHTYDGLRTLNGRTGLSRVDAAPGSEVRVRVINTDNGPLRAWVSGAPFRVVAIDGQDLLGPPPVRDRYVLVPAGGRADLALTVPAGGARVDVGADTALVLGQPGRTVDAVEQPAEPVDLLSYGTPQAAPFDVRDADRTFDYRIGRRIGFIDGRPGFWWSINGKLFPDVPMYMVEEGDVVRIRITNSSGDVHPMHLHGHHALVLSRNGVPATGSPWWVDSLEVADDETYEIAFVADNPGVWMFHCHNLAHAAEGLVAHLAYAGVTEPYRVGAAVGTAHNEPE